MYINKNNTSNSYKLAWIIMMIIHDDSPKKTLIINMMIIHYKTIILQNKQPSRQSSAAPWLSLFGQRLPQLGTLKLSLSETNGQTSQLTRGQGRGELTLDLATNGLVGPWISNV